MKDETCRCFPWYVYARYIKEDGEINTELYDALLDYWTNQLSEEQQITFDSESIMGYIWFMERFEMELDDVLVYRLTDLMGNHCICKSII